MRAEINQTSLAAVQVAALRLCQAQGSCDLVEVVRASRIDRALVRDALALLTRRGHLLSWPGDRFAMPFARPGSSWPTDIRPPVSALMVARA